MQASRECGAEGFFFTQRIPVSLTRASTTTPKASTSGSAPLVPVLHASFPASDETEKTRQLMKGALKSDQGA
jgi:hypothetical protein